MQPVPRRPGVLSVTQKRLIIQIAAATCGLSPEALLDRSRQPLICEARWVAQSMLYRRGLTYSQIASVFGHRCHTSVMHGLRRVHSDEALAGKVREAEQAMRDLRQAALDQAVGA